MILSRPRERLDVSRRRDSSANAPRFNIAVPRDEGINDLTTWRSDAVIVGSIDARAPSMTADSTDVERRRSTAWRGRDSNPRPSGYEVAEQGPGTIGLPVFAGVRPGSMESDLLKTEP